MSVPAALPRRRRLAPPQREVKRVQPGSGNVIQLDARRATREYVAGGGPGWTQAAARTLPHPIDDLSLDFGNDIYAEMLKDAQVSAAVYVIKASILEDGLTLAPSIEDQTKPKYKKAVAIRDAAKRMLERLDQALDDVLWNMLDAIAYGNKVAELVYEWQVVGGEKLLQLKAIKPKPRELVSFVVDPYMNLLGIIGAKPGELAPSSISVDPVLQASQIIARDKFCLLTNHPENSDPRGTSSLRAAYAPWWEKRQLGPEYLRYLTQFASPSIWGTPPEGIEQTPDTDPLGNPVDAEGDVIADPDDPTLAVEPPLTPQEEMLALLIEFRNSYAMALPAGSEVHAIEMIGNGEAFLNAFTLFNGEIVKAILTQSLATEEGQHQARSAATVHQDVLDTLIRQGKKSVIRMLYHDILTPWVQHNWGDDAAEELVPIPSLGTTEQQDLPGLMTAVAALMRAAYFEPHQLQYIDLLLGIPVRDLTQAPQPQPAPSPAPGEPSAPGGGDAGKGGKDVSPNPGAPSGPAERGGRGKQPATQPARKDQP